MTEIKQFLTPLWNKKSEILFKWALWLKAQDDLYSLLKEWNFKNKIAIIDQVEKIEWIPKNIKRRRASKFTS